MNGFQRPEKPGVAFCFLVLPLQIRDVVEERPASL
jgi:hypothetical protein